MRTNHLCSFFVSADPLGLRRSKRLRQNSMQGLEEEPSGSRGSKRRSRDGCSRPQKRARKEAPAADEEMDTSDGGLLVQAVSTENHDSSEDIADDAVETGSSTQTQSHDHSSGQNGMTSSQEDEANVADKHSEEVTSRSDILNGSEGGILLGIHDVLEDSKAASECGASWCDEDEEREDVMVQSWLELENKEESELAFEHKQSKELRSIFAKRAHKQDPDTANDSPGERATDMSFEQQVSVRLLQLRDAQKMGSEPREIAQVPLLGSKDMVGPPIPPTRPNKGRASQQKNARGVTFILGIPTQAYTCAIYET